MAGEWPQETGQGQGSDRVFLKEREDHRLGGVNQVRKRQPELLPGGGKWRRWGTGVGRVIICGRGKIRLSDTKTGTRGMIPFSARMTLAIGKRENHVGRGDEMLEQGKDQAEWIACISFTYFLPKGLWGRLYWFLTGIIFTLR